MSDTDPEMTLSPAQRDLLDQVLDKWSLSIMSVLCGGPCRFNDLRRAIPVVTQKSLTAALRRLERNGLIERRILQTRPVAVEYSITALGKTSRDPIDVMLAWADQHMAEIDRARELFDDTEGDAAAGVLPSASR